MTGLRRQRWREAVIILVLLGGSASPAQAASLRVFRLPAEPVDQAVVRFAIQGSVSVGGLPAPGCEGRSRPVVGVLAPETALARLLPEGCGFERIDARTFRIVGRRPVIARTVIPAPAAPAAASIDELIVTAEKRLEPLIASPFPVSALSGEEIARLGAESFQDLAPQMVGVTVTNLGSGRNKIFVRGMSDGSFTGKTQSTVGLYLDDVPITYNAPDPDLRLADIERVEVLRGPQGTLYGSGSIGGIVRLVTAQPDPSSYSGYLAAEGAVTEDGAPSSGFEGMFNAPVRALGGAVRAVAWYDERGGYIRNVRLGLKNVNYSRRSGLRVTGLTQAAGWTVLARFAHQSINTADTQYTQGSDGSLTRDAQLREPHDNDFTEISLVATRSVAGAELKVSAAQIEHAFDTRYDATGALGTTGSAAVDQSQRVRLSLVQAELTSNGAGKTHWLAGVFGSLATERDQADLGDPDGGERTSVYRRNDRLSEGAVYGELSYDITPRITATAGGRFFATRLTSRAGDFGLAASPVPDFDGEQTYRGFSPKLRLAYAAAPDAVIYAQVQEGYRAGGFNMPVLGADTAPGDVFAPRFQPDRLLSYEIGGELPLFDRRLVLRAAAFRADWSRMQTDQYLPSGLPMTVNIGDGQNTGLELEAAWRPDSHLQVRANALLEDPQLTRSTGVFPARPDIGLPGVPNSMGAGDISYRWNIGRLEVNVSAEYAYVGHSYLTFAGGPASVMGGYGSGRISGELTGGRWRVQAYVDNLARETGNTFAFGNPFTTARGPQATPLRPRTLGVVLKRTF
jgi:iron complex outermembrane receptor protein